MTTTLTLTIDGDVEPKVIATALERGGLKKSAFELSETDQQTEEN